MWPTRANDLVDLQRALAAEEPPPWRADDEEELLVGGCWVCFPRGREGVGEAGDPAWAAAALLRAGRREATSTVHGAAGAAYETGLLALREGPLLEEAVRGLPRLPRVLLVNASGRDHPRRAGLALHLGAALGVPTVGVTHRPLYATGEWPEDRAGAASPLVLDGEVVGSWVRTRRGRRPVAVHAGWRIDVPTAVEVVLRCGGGAGGAQGATGGWAGGRGAGGGGDGWRTPAPLREARHLARLARAAAG